MTSATHLLRTRRFLPLFVAQFLCAFNNNLFKNAVIVLAAYGLAEKAGMDAEAAAALAGGVFMLPFVLFSAMSGQLADAYEKSLLIRVTKFVEFPCMALAAAGLIYASFPLMLVALFLLGTQAAFFGTLKYSILPAHLQESEMVGANGLMEAGAFLAILGGTICGGLLVVRAGVETVALLGLALAAVGFAASLCVPKAPVTKIPVKLQWNFVRACLDMFTYARSHREIAPLMPGIAWFWLVGSVLLTQLPAFVKDKLHGNEAVITLCLVLFSVGIAVGSMLCNRLLKGKVSAAIAPLGATGIALFMLMFSLGASVGGGETTALAGITEFMSVPKNWLVLLSLPMIAVCGGIYVVPLQAMLQVRTEEHHRARMIAASNTLNALFMVLSSVGVVVLLSLGLSLTGIIALLAVLNLGVAWYARRLI